ncbi:MAG: SHOCT domain-containing protein [Acidiferrobacteraceae bacterium]
MWTYGPWDLFPWMWLFPLIFLGVILLFLFRGAGRPMCGGRGTPKGEGSARDILDRRYARGEITREEYQRMGKDLE